MHFLKNENNLKKDLRKRLFSGEVDFGSQGNGEIWLKQFVSWISQRRCTKGAFDKKLEKKDSDLQRCFITFSVFPIESNSSGDG